MDRKQRSMSVDTSETLARQVEISADEIRLLRNKVNRLEDDLLMMTQERDGLLVQLDKIEDKAMKSFTTMSENEQVDITGENSFDSVVLKQMNGLKKKIGKFMIHLSQPSERRKAFRRSL